jgi:hypothetical protein
MRTRIRSQAQHVTVRRRHVARRPPDVELVLQLQHTIGNRATIQLLQRTPQVLTKAGIKTDSRVSDKTPGMIQTALEESVELKPFLKGKFPGSAVTKDFEIHTDEKSFNTAIKAHFKNTEPMTDKQMAEAYGGYGGFVERANRRIHVRSRSTFGHAVHEAMHRVSSSGFRGFWGDFLNEGVTQLFADRLLVEHGLTKVTDHKYKDELACAEKLVALTDVNTVAAAYFQNDGKLREAVMKELKVDLHDLSRLDGKTICARLP